MKRVSTILAVMLLCVPSWTTAQGDISQKIQEGVDSPTLRCPGGIISERNSIEEVVAMCGKPIRIAKTIDYPFGVWVYHFDDSNLIYYLVMSGRKLHRIVEAMCWDDDLDCR